MPHHWLKRKVNALELYTIDVILGRRAGASAALYGAFLQSLSFLWAAGARAKVWLYRHRILRDQPLGCLVVVVGNLTAGGTGKTPVVEKFARALRDRGRKVAILSRGYKSKRPPLWRRWWIAFTHAEEPPPKVVSDGENVLLDSEEAGDEPYMLARNLPGVLVLVDKNRVKAGEYAIKKFGCDTLVLDDGFQYLPLKGRLNLLQIGDITVIDDSYNATTLSMQLGLDTLSQTAKPGQRRVAILGHMAALGDESVRYHSEIGNHARRCADVLIGVGDLARHYGPDHWFEDSKLCANALDTLVHGGDCVFVKGSFAAKMGCVVQGLRDLAVEERGNGRPSSLHKQGL